ncbi:interleukin-12 subunit alpha [Clinocottus analis]|uniref:interleukin-12 subunit alpha n=1 Tax=Clinocottus analis TaxID=304258 RepID=UPI0035BFD012
MLTGNVRNAGFSSCVLLLFLMSSRPATGLPVRAQGAGTCGDCALLFRNLLRNITQLLSGVSTDVLCFGIVSDRMTARSPSDTVLACAPTLTQNSSCMMQRNSSFSESECLRNIRKDLSFYAAAIQSYLRSPLRNPGEEVALLSPTLEMMQSLRKSCSLMPDGESDSLEEAAEPKWEADAYSNRLKMCKMMRGFHVRAITINRALGYISSGDHRK